MTFYKKTSVFRTIWNITGQDDVIASNTMLNAVKDQQVYCLLFLNSNHSDGIESATILNYL